MKTIVTDKNIIVDKETLLLIECITNDGYHVNDIRIISEKDKKRIKKLTSRVVTKYNGSGWTRDVSTSDVRRFRDLLPRSENGIRSISNIIMYDVIGQENIL